MHEPRLAILHSPRFHDLHGVLNFIDTPSWVNANPEIVLIREGLLVPHFLDGYIKNHYIHTASFHVGSTTSHQDARWAALSEASSYATHLLAFVEYDDVLLKRFLKDASREKRPTRIVMV